MLSPRLYAYGRPLSSPFGLLGADERALTFALGYTLSRCPDFLQGFLRLVGAGGLQKRTLQQATIYLERKYVADRSITDMEVAVERRLRVIVEAKVGLAVPTVQQCENYLRVLQGGPPALKRRLVILTAVANDADLQSYKQERPHLAEVTTGLEWTQLRHLATKLMGRRDQVPGARWLTWFVTFLGKGYTMRSFTHEVWIVPVNKKPLWPGGMSFYDTHVKGGIYYWRTHHHVRPLYIALRVNGKVSTIQRVLEVVHDVPPSKYVPQLRGNGLSWADEPHTIWRLDKPVALPRPLPVGYKLGQATLYCDLDLLLTCTSIKEISEQMKARNQAEGKH